MGQEQAIADAVGLLAIRRGMTVLDAGCGEGGVIPLLAEAVGDSGRVVGIDDHPEALAAARAAHGERIAAGQLDLRVGDLQALPFDDESFDAVWMYSVLHHVEQPARAIRELTRVLRPGGRLAVLDGDNGGTFPFLPWRLDLEIALRTAVWRAARDGYGGRLAYTFHGHIGRNIPRLLREAGLTEIEVHASTVVDRYPLTPERTAELRDWVTGSFLMRTEPYLAPVDLAAVRALFDPTSADDLLASPDFFMIRTSPLTIGHRPAAGST